MRFKKLKVLTCVILATVATLIVVISPSYQWRSPSGQDSRLHSDPHEDIFLGRLQRDGGNAQYYSSKHTSRGVQEVQDEVEDGFIRYGGDTDQEISGIRHLDQLVADLKEALPATYLNSTVNPCWYAGPDELSPGSLSCIPAFYLMGYPKCGTTELYNLLGLHPRFAQPYRKEPHWWTSEKSLADIKTSFRKYIHWFRNPAREIETDPRKITGDCSASTAWRNIFDLDRKDFPPFGIPYVFSKLFPHAKFIVIMRDPVSHLYSRFWYNCKLADVVSTKLQERGPEIFTTLVRRHIAGMSKCVQETGSAESCSYLPFRRPYLPPLSASERVLVNGKECGYIGFGDSIYYLSLKEWFRFIPRSQILVLRTEDMAKDTLSVAQTMFKFLGMGEMDPVELAQGIALLGHANSQAETKSSRLLLPESTIDILREFFNPYNVKLANLLNDDNFLWV